MKECPACNRCFPDSLNHCPTDGDALRFTIAGDTLLDGRYQLERRLGQGGMGCVYKGRHVFLKTSHAIKVILPDLVGNDPSLLTRFRQEAMAAAAIRHQNIISVTDFGVVNNTTPFLVMEFLEGRSLHELLTAEGRLKPAHALEIMLAVASGVGAAHKQGIVHRDLKPLNIMLKDGHSASEGVKVLDFGLAKIKSGDLLGSFVAAKTQGLMGSPFYMAPEQWGDDEPDACSDIYSMGVILYQMIAGEVPFRGSTIPSIMNKHLTAAPPPLAEKGVEAPPEVERAVAHALQKEPAKRPQSIDEFAADMRDALTALGAAPAVGFSTDPDIGVKTVAITEPGTFPPAPPAEPGEQSAGRIVQAGTVAGDAARGDGRKDEAPPRGFETVPLPDSLRNQTAPPPDFTQARETSHEISGGMGSMRDVAHEGPQGEVESSLPPSGQESRAQAHESQKTNYVAQSKKTQPLAAHQQTAREIAQPPQTPAQPSPAPPPPAPRFAPQHPAQAVAAAPVWSRLPVAVWAAAGVLALLCVVAGLYLFLGRSSGGEVTTNVVANRGGTTNVSANAGANMNAGAEQGEPVKPDIVPMRGGSFMMGRDDVPPRTSSVALAYQAWLYNQWPAHAVSIRPFAIDRTEVTNAEYAEFVEKTGYPPPPDWDGKRSPSGQEQWPVRNVTLEDAERFAKWRSQRDGVEYRLPTEAEWEYAARGGDASRLFPWGGDWVDGRANIDSDSLKPVGSFPGGATPQGAQDMVGNVWEWTSTPAAMYRGNKLLVLAPGDAGKVVVRGGSFQSKARGEEPITSTARRWVVRDKKDPVIGFRLIRPGR